MTNVHGEVCLPESARQRLTALRDAQTATNALINDLHDRARHEIRRKVAAEDELRNSLRWSGNLPELLPEQKFIQGRIDSAAAAVADFNARMASVPRSSLSGRSEQFVKRLRAPVAAKIVTPKLGRGEAPLEAVKRLRAEQAQIKADLHHTRSAPIPSAEAKQIVRDQV